MAPLGYVILHNIILSELFTLLNIFAYCHVYPSAYINVLKMITINIEIYI